YFISLIVVIGAEIACGTWFYINQDVALKSVSEIIDETYTQDFKKIIDLLQTKLQCCGVHGPDDWTENGIPIPESCGNQTCSDCLEDTPEIQQVGCGDRIRQYLTTVASIVGGIILLQVLVIVFSIILCRAIREAEEYDDDDKSFS
ncbi:putative CD9 antigen, partial [Apostichopus japonicus]